MFLMGYGSAANYPSSYVPDNTERKREGQPGRSADGVFTIPILVCAAYETELLVGTLNATIDCWRLSRKCPLMKCLSTRDPMDFLTHQQVFCPEDEMRWLEYR